MHSGARFAYELPEPFTRFAATICIDEAGHYADPSLLDRLRRDFKVAAAEVDGLDTWNRMLEDPRGFILVTAHIGHWELDQERDRLEWSDEVHRITWLSDTWRPVASLRVW